MQAIIEKRSGDVSPKVIFFRKPMAAAPIPPPSTQGPNWHDPGRQGTHAAIAAALFALLAAIAAMGTCYVNASNRSDQKTLQAQQAEDKYVDGRIDNKLNPAVEKISKHIDEKLAPIQSDLSTLKQDVAELKGQFEQLNRDQKRISARVDQQQDSLAKQRDLFASQQVFFARMLDPDRALRTIRESLQSAQTQRVLLAPADVAEYRDLVRVLPRSAHEYWQTAAAIINYQSFVNQIENNAPDPAKVSVPCGGLTTGKGGGNVFKDIVISGCVVDLDSTQNALIGVVLKDDVIRYHGGPLPPMNVIFVNCTFEFDLPAVPVRQLSRPATNLILTLLNSPTQTNVKAENTPES